MQAVRANEGVRGAGEEQEEEEEEEEEEVSDLDFSNDDRQR